MADLPERAEDRVQRKLPHYDRGKPRIAAFLRPGCEAVDELDRTFAALRDAFYLSTATGPALDNLAARWGLTRYADENDDRLRDRVRREIAYCLQSATIEDLKRCLEWGLGWDARAIRIKSNFSPATKEEFEAFFEVLIPFSWLGKPEGVYFRFAEDPEESTYNSDNGFNRAGFRPPTSPFLEYPVQAEELLERLAAVGVRFRFGVYGGFRFSDDPKTPTFDSDYGFDRGKLVGILARR
ncbi:MAG: hypothetical protein QXX12_01125 [Nanopusillaceae archaeon]